jgi:predicted transcriptional regulator
MVKKYKTKELYICFALNRLVQELDIDLYQDGLEEELDAILYRQRGIPKTEISNEIRTNHHQTNKILEFLLEKAYVEVEKGERSYTVKITKEGLIYIRRFNEFFISMYEDIIRDHYKYKKLPAWFYLE